MELARGSERAELLCKGGSTARVSLPALRVERLRRSGAWERGMSQRARGMGFWGSCNARARARRRRRALSWPGHGDGEVAAARAVLAAWRRERAPALGKEGGGMLRRDAWKPRGAGGGLGAALHGGVGAALHSGGGNRVGELEEWEKDPNAIFEISRDQTVK